MFPNAFNSMIAINEAQTKSLLQHTKAIPPNELIMEISMEKGGTSVLADGYLVEGDMTEEDALFAFGLGVVCLPFLIFLGLNHSLTISRL